MLDKISSELKRISKIETANNFDKQRRESYDREQRLRGQKFDKELTIAQAKNLSDPNRIDMMCISASTQPVYTNNQSLRFSIVKNRIIDKRL